MIVCDRPIDPGAGRETPCFSAMALSGHSSLSFHIWAVPWPWTRASHLLLPHHSWFIAVNCCCLRCTATSASAAALAQRRPLQPTDGVVDARAPAARDRRGHTARADICAPTTKRGRGDKPPLPTPFLLAAAAGCWAELRNRRRRATPFRHTALAATPSAAAISDAASSAERVTAPRRLSLFTEHALTALAPHIPLPSAAARPPTRTPFTVGKATQAPLV